MRSRSRLTILLTLLVLLYPGLTRSEGARAESSKLPLVDGRPELLKVSSSLLQARSLLQGGTHVDQIRDRLPSLNLRQDLVDIEIRLASDPPPSGDLLATAGFHLAHLYPEHKVAFGSISLERIGELAALAGVRSIQPHYRPLTFAGSVYNQGDASIRGDLARASLGIDGVGVSVGILSDSFSKTGLLGGTRSPANPELCPVPYSSTTITGVTSQASGDLPPQVIINDDCDSTSSYCSGVRDEGAAMAELIHDIAPGADLAFHSTFNSRIDFADGIDELRLCGADILVDDTIYLNEPMFQDGLIAQAVQRAVDAGVPYFAAAGNQGTPGVDESFDDLLAADEEDEEPSGIDFHDFANGGGDPYAAITVPAGCGITAVLQWNEPFDDPLGGGARTDLDLYICQGDPGQTPDAPPFNPQQSPCQYFSQNAQGCGAGEPVNGAGEPLEILDYLNSTGSPQTVHLAVDHYCGDVDGDVQEDDSVRFRIVTFGLNCSLAEPGYSFEPGVFDRGQIYGHAAAAGAVAVGAVFYEEIDSGGTADPPSGQIDVEPFASAGGDLPFYFDGSGNPLPGAPLTRSKPEITAPDGGNTTFFGSDIPEDADSFPNFFGSSAAAANAAGIAALMLEANPDLNPSDVRSILQATAIDIETAGPDSLSGEGLIDAVDATALSLPVPSTNPANLSWGVIGLSDSVEKILTLENETTGPADLQVTSMGLSDNGNFGLDWSAGPNPCGSSTPTLAPGSTCTIGVSFGPAVEGSFPATLTIQSNAADLVVGLSGQGQASSISLTKSASPEQVNFEGGLVTFTIEVQNDSAWTDPVTLSSLTDDIYGDITDDANNALVSTDCELGQAIPSGEVYECSFQAMVEGTGPNPHVDVVTGNGMDDDGDPVEASDSASVVILTLSIFEDGFESGTIDAWSSSL